MDIFVFLSFGNFHEFSEKILDLRQNLPSVSKFLVSKTTLLKYVSHPKTCKNQMVFYFTGSIFEFCGKTAPVFQYCIGLKFCHFWWEKTLINMLQFLFKMKRPILQTWFKSKFLKYSLILTFTVQYR